MGKPPNSFYSHQQEQVLLRKIHEAKLQDNESVRKMYRAAVMSKSPQLFQALEGYINPILVREQLEDFPFNPTIFPYEDYEPETRIILGKILQEDKRFSLSVEHLRQHLLVLGAPGTGKTVLLEHLIHDLANLNIKVLVLDRDKVELRQLLNLIPALNIFSIEKNFIFNPLEVPTNVDPQHWLVAFVSVFCKYNDLLSGSESLMVRAVTELYEEFGVFRGSTDTYPTMIDLYLKVLSYQFKGNRRDAGFKDSILNRLYAYISLYKHVYSYAKGIPIEWIKNNNIILECRGVTERVARFQMGIILYSLFMHKIATNHTISSLSNAVFIDECKFIASPFNDKLGFSPLAYAMAQSRAVGIGFVLADQTANLEDALFVNSSTKFCFRLGDGRDMRKAGFSMGLNARQMQYLTRLKTGECVMRAIDEDEPFVLKVKQPLTK